jgi:hypothetical protein
MNAWYEAGSLKMLALVIVLFGWTGTSLHAAAAARARAAVASHLVAGLFIGISPISEAQ